MPEFIYTMREVTKVHPPDKKVLENITLAFFPGAKIGVIGANGSGKSSLLRIMAGVDTEHYGEARPHPGTRVGISPGARARLRPLPFGMRSRSASRTFVPSWTSLKRSTCVSVSRLNAEEMEAVLAEQAICRRSDRCRRCLELGDHPADSG